MIAIVDYGMGNLRSVSKALEHFGANVTITGDPKRIEQADSLVLPGVGAFGDAMAEIRQKGLEEAIVHFSKSQKPFLGICLGLQILFEKSEESPEIKGLGILEGSVQAFTSEAVKIPHMGWNDAALAGTHPMLEGLQDNSFFYFVHSYYVVPKNESVNLGTCQYGEENFAAIVGTDTLIATQFHPEKSQEAGLRILKNFVNWKP